MSVNPQTGSGSCFRPPPRERYDESVSRESLAWQSKLILLMILPVVGCDLVLKTHDYLQFAPHIVFWTLGLSAALGILTLALRAATPFAALTGFMITAQLMYASSGRAPFNPWRTFIVPVLAVALLAYLATRIGRSRKEKLGTAEARRGRSAAQVAANLGVAALGSGSLVALLATNIYWTQRQYGILLIASLAAMAEAAADTVSSEIGQVFGGRPRMITTFRTTEPGIDGGITLIGSLAGIAAAAIVTGLTILAIGGGWQVFNVALAAAVAGLFFDSLLGATLERRGWLNNDAVNFLSTVCASVVAASLAGRFANFVT
jgi:uncharacterized protein (TIGR00297 family)